jgi:hypothetical protein
MGVYLPALAVPEGAGHPARHTVGDRPAGRPAARRRRRPWGIRRGPAGQKEHGIAAIVALIVVLAACGTSHITKAPAAAPATTAPATTAPAAPAATQAPTSAPAAAPLTGPVGTTYTVSGTGNSGNATSYTVTLTQIDQQASPANSFETAPAGHHLIAARFTVTARPARPPTTPTATPR